MVVSLDHLVARLLELEEPSIRLGVRLNLQGARENEIRVLRDAVARSARVAALLSERTTDGTIDAHPYRAKWYGAHWVLATLADLGYPSGDESLIPLRDQMVGWLFSSDYLRSLGRVRGLPRLHGSIEGNALWSMMSLGLADESAELLAERLRSAQWPDGGWNCDRKASGRSSSFTESLIPLRALALHAQLRSDRASAEAAGAAAEFFLRHRLCRRLQDGTIVDARFCQLHYPWYWHYDILFGLVVMAEAGRLADARCVEALDLLESKRLTDGGFPAEHAYYRTTRAMVPSQRSLVSWGGTSQRRMNPWVSLRAAVVLHTAGRSVGPGILAPGEREGRRSQ